MSTVVERWSRAWGLPIIIIMLAADLFTTGRDEGRRDQEIASLERSVASLQRSVSVVNQSIATDDSRLSVLEKLEALRDRLRPPVH